LVRFLEDGAADELIRNAAPLLASLRDDCVEWIRHLEGASLPAGLRSALLEQLQWVIRLTEQDVDPIELQKAAGNLLSRLSTVAAQLPEGQAKEWRSKIAKTAAAVVLVVGGLKAPLDLLEVADAVRHSVEATLNHQSARALEAPPRPAPLAIEGRADGDDEVVA
jgi:hypothetical protein